MLHQEFAYTAEKVMFMRWLWTGQVVSINRSFYHLAAPRVSLRDRIPVLGPGLPAQPDLVTQNGDSRLASHHVSCQKSLDVVIFLRRASLALGCLSVVFGCM